MGEMHRYTDDEKAYFLRRMWAEGLTPASAARLWGNHPNRATVAGWLRQLAEGRLEVEPVRVPHSCEGRHEKHKRYPADTRREALRLMGLGVGSREVARALGLPSAATPTRWAREERERAGRATMSAEAVCMEGDGTRGATGVAGARSAGGTGAAEAPSPDGGPGELDRLRLEVAALREMLSDPKAGDPERLSNRRKAELGERLRRDYGFPLRRVLTYFRISKSSYEYERRALARPREADEAFDARVAAAFRLLRGTAGYRRVAACMREGAGGVAAGPAPERRVRESMRRQGLRARRGRRPRRPYSSYAGEVDERPENVPRERARARRAAGEDFRLAHDFSAGRPGELLVTDVTEFSLNGFKVYLSPVIDCWDGCPVAWSASARPDQELCSSSLEAALALEPEGALPTVHTDGGSCYRSHEWKAACAAAGARRSMSRKAACPDNARAEAFFGTLKQEFLYSRGWEGATRGEFLARLADYMGWYVRGRPKGFREEGRVRYEAPAARRRRLGAVAPSGEGCVLA
ncbi:MAG: IS3 family transposase [Atopobiaceae bacterium]|nr:IS3 family transposase [Olsenella sp.]MDY3900258.1 IS3 family transposase [Atopobiaceae bacterium]